jgi:hypothetical protein
VPAGGRRRQEVRQVPVQPAAHRGQRCRARPQRRLQAVDRHGDDRMTAAQRGGLRRDPAAEITSKARDDDVGPGQRHPSVGGQAVVRDPAVPLTRIRVTDPQAGHRTPAQCGRRVDRLARRHAGKAPAGPRPQIARALRDDRHVGAQHVPGGEQAGMHGDRLQVAAERLPGRDHRRQPSRVAQRRAGAGEPGGQGSAILHDVANTRGAACCRAVNAWSFGPREEASQHGRESGVQVGHHHGHPAEVIGVAKHVVVGRSLFVRAEHGRLQRRVTALDQVAREHGVGRQAVGNRHHEGVAAGAEIEVGRGGVEQHPVAGAGAPGERGVGERYHRRPVHRHVKLDRAGPLAPRPADHPVPPCDHPGSLTVLASAASPARH